MLTRLVLGMACAATAFTFVKTLTTPVVSVKPSPLVLPEQLPLSDWQWFNHEQVDRSNTYYYRDQETTLKIHTTLQQGGNLPSKIRNQWRVPETEIMIRKVEKLGSYGLFVTEEAAFLTACINPNGTTTVTAQQFSRNQLWQAVQPQRVMALALDQTAVFRDPRCLRLTLSTPLESQRAETVLPLLETAWRDLNARWQPEFPQI